MISLEEFKELLRQAGSHFFDESTMKWWGSKVHTGLSEKGYFITSEWNGFDRTKRAYTVRQVKLKPVGVRTVGVFGGYKTLYRAMAALKQYEQDGEQP